MGERHTLRFDTPGQLLGNSAQVRPLLSNYRMKLAGRGRPFATARRQPGGARDGLADRAAALQLMRGR